MEYSFLVSSSQGDEYRILFLPADEEYLSPNVRACLHERGIFMHLISRDEHREIVDLVKSDIRQGYAKPEFD